MTDGVDTGDQSEDWEDVAGRALCLLQESLTGMADALSRLADERRSLREEVDRLRTAEAAALEERQRHARLANELAELAGSVSSLVAGVTGTTTSPEPLPAYVSSPAWPPPNNDEPWTNQ